MLRGAPRQFVSWMQRSLVLLAAVVSCVTVLFYRLQLDNGKNTPRPSTYELPEYEYEELEVHLNNVISSGMPLNADLQWTWICRNQKCTRMFSSESQIFQSLQTCNMLCSSSQLWPQPKGPVSFANSAVPVRVDGFRLQVVSAPSKDVEEYLREAFALMKEDLRLLQRAENKEGTRGDAGPLRDLTVRVSVNGSGDVRMRLDTDESYTLILRPEKVSLVAYISAKSFCGARHGFETLSQLVWMDPYEGSMMALESARVEDAPAFGYRGLLLDTARNYFPVGDLLRTIDAMGWSKLNTFHWHCVDSQAFPLRLAGVPHLAAHGAYGPGAVYTPEDVRAVVHRARLRGVRVLLEVDAPAHVGRAWSWGPQHGLGELAHCVEADPWAVYCIEPPCGQLNPRNPHVYRLLERVYQEIIALTGVDDLFHLGGDEVSERCWQEHFNDTDPMELWMEFTQRAMRALERANGGKMPKLTLLWSSRLTRSPYLERLEAAQLGVQVWGASFGPQSRAELDAGFRTVISHFDAWYLDCGFGSWIGSSNGYCSYHSWQQVYEHRPWAEEPPRPPAPTPAARWRVEGGAVCLWTEQLGAGGLDARMWPRAAALAERLWADAAEGATPDVYLRLDTWRARQVARGLRAAPLWPRWCSHNPHACLKLHPSNFPLHGLSGPALRPGGLLLNSVHNPIPISIVVLMLFTLF